MKRKGKIVKFVTSMSWIKIHLQGGYRITRILEDEKWFVVKMANGSSKRSILVPKCNGVENMKAFVMELKKILNEVKPNNS